MQPFPKHDSPPCSKFNLLDTTQSSIKKFTVDREREKTHIRAKTHSLKKSWIEEHAQRFIQDSPENLSKRSIFRAPERCLQPSHWSGFEVQSIGVYSYTGIHFMQGLLNNLNVCAAHNNDLGQRNWLSMTRPWNIPQATKLFLLVCDMGLIGSACRSGFSKCVCVVCVCCTENWDIYTLSYGLSWCHYLEHNIR